MNNPSQYKLSRVSEILICVFYTWYFLPVCNALFWSGPFKLLAIGCLIAGLTYWYFLNGLRFNFMLVAVLGYMAVFSLLWILGIGDSHAHIRVSFTFWGTALAYAVLNEEARLRVGKYLLFLFIVTYVTSAIGVLLDNNAARTIAHAAADDDLQRGFKMKNIASIYLFQCSIFFVPIFLTLPQTLKAKIGAGVLLSMSFVVLVNASFTIALIMFVFTLLLSVILKEQVKVNRFVVATLLGAALLAVFFNGSELLTMAGRAVKSDKVAVRLFELRDMIYLGQSAGDAALRNELYLTSLRTFGENIFGVGPNYSYIMFDGGIGHHSQVLDDLARYGVCGLAFYIMFFLGYYLNLKNEWAKLGRPQIAFVITATYLIFLILNLGFRNAEESVIALFIMPILPSILLKRMEKARDDSQMIY